MFKLVIQLVIQVSDGGTPPLSISITVNVFVLSANDNDPGFFNAPYIVTVDENIALGDLVAQSTPFDDDLLESYDFQHTSCAILAGADSSKFSIDITTGTITLFEPLDFETAAQHVIGIEITDLDIAPAKSATATVTINVNNVNDNTPVCTKALYPVTIDETTAGGTNLLNLGCTDVEDATLVYTITTGDTTKFEVTGGGDVNTLTTIDVDTEANSWTLVIKCRDRDTVTKLTTTVTVQVFVTGVDDNVPVWAAPESGTYTASVDENVSAGSLVATISATDADQTGTTDSTITYSMETASTEFGIDSSSGQVSVIGSLDRETTETYSLTISAYSSTLTGSKITGTLTVTINDLNDNSPVFAQAIITPAAAIAEDTAPNTALLTVAATDADKLTNGQVTYSINSGNTATGCIMAIGSASGEITNTASLDYESATSCTLIIHATDGGAPALVSTATAIITISPVNEATPAFGADFTTSFPESDTIGTSVTAAVATDTDTGNDGVIKYSLNTFGSIFNIDENTGDIYLATDVDRETTASYVVVVHGVDQSDTTKKTGSVSITINIDDVNDNTPSCTPTVLHQQLTSPTVGDTVDTLACTDADTGVNAALTYAITSGNTNNDFSISTSGVVTVANSPSQTDYQLTIVVSDTGTTPLSTTVYLTMKVYVVPTFTALPTAENVIESTSIGTVIHTVLAPTSSGSTSFQIQSGNGDGKFSLDSISGKISVYGTLDRETTASYSLLIRVTDTVSTLTADATLTITIDDANDNTPSCTSAVIYQQLTTPTVGDTVDTLACTDADTGVNAALTYAITSGNTNTDFSISTSGVVTVANSPSQTDYQLTIVVSDTGTTPLSTTVYLTIKVYVVPTFTALPTTENVIESTTIGTVVHTVLATTASGSKSFQIQSGNGDGKFSLDSISGKISVYGTVDRETTASYSLLIRVTDTVSTLTADATLTITIDDANDNTPSCTSTVIYQQLTSPTVGDTVDTLACTDADTGVNAALTYAITSGNTNTDFSISTSGVVTVANSPSQTDYQVTIVVSDTGTTPLSTTVYLTIKVYVVPTFAALPTTENVIESTAIGAVVHTVVATTASGSKSFQIQSGNGDGKFSLDLNTGKISLYGALDRETTASYSLLIRVTDTVSTLTADATLTITVDDANDNIPSCTPTVLYQQLTSATVGDTVDTLACTDADTGVNAALTYAITSGNTNTDFAISTSGVVTVANSPSQTDYQLMIVVSDTGTTPLSTTVYLTIKIYVIPTFAALPTTETIIESTSIGTLLHTVLATAASGSKSFQIQSGNGDGKFSLNSISGKIFLYGTLDRETTASYSLLIRVTDTVSTLTADATLTITLTDFNDITPSFANSFYSLSVVENVVAATAVQDLSATDTDDGVNAALTYTIVSGNADGKFDISTAGLLSTAATLDAETTQSYTLIVTANDNGATPLTGTTTVYVSVTNVDEFPMSFDVAGNAYTDTQAEDTATGTTFFTVTAQDQDIDTTISYSITAGNGAGLFVIDSTTGEIILSNFLDRETAASHSLTITADNGDGSTLDATLDITVSDVNDNDPDFSPSLVYTFSVDENQLTGITVGTVTASDIDSGVNANIVLSLVGGNTGTAFQLVGSDIKLLGTLDYETTPSYILLIEALDQGVPARSSTATVNIAVNPIYAQPQVASTNDAVTIAENIALNTDIYDMNAILSGAVEGVAGDLKYVIQSGNVEGKFFVSLYTGVLTVVGSLDRETTPSYVIVIRAENRNDASKRDTVSVAITVTDINDNGPVFASTLYTWSIDEGLVANSSPGTVAATDADSGTNAAISYSILSGEGNSDFTIDGTTGVVSTTVVLSAATQSSYLLTVVAVDTGTTPLTGSCSIAITVNDVNDQVPTFSQSTYNYAISEGVSVSDTVFSFYAADSDTGANGRVDYNIVSGNGALKFSLGSSDGQLVMANTLDRESLSSYVLVVEAVDNGATPNTGTTTLSVTVTDINDNTPVFATNPYTAIVLRTAATSTTVATVVATDTDEGTNSDLRYSITSGNPDNLFYVDSISGAVMTLGSLTAASDTYSLVIQAEDQGVSYRSATTTLSVTLDPVNSPAASDLTFTVSESVATSSAIGTVSTNPVHAAGATIDFTIVSGNQGGDFQIGLNDGAITNINTLDYETTTDYYLLINLKDTTNPTLDYDKNVHIIVTDSNDLTPVCNPASYTKPLVENSPIGTTVVQITATDGDSGLNAQMTFEISTAFPLGTTYLQIDNTGVITVKQVVDYETVTSIVFEVLVKDGGSPTNTATAAVTLNIIDVLDTATVTGTASHFFSLECATEASNGDVITTLTGTDFGLTVGATDTLAFLTLSSGGVFTVGSSSGDFSIQDQTYLFSETRYFMDVIAEVTTAANVVTSSSGLIRVDTFVATTSVVVLTHSVDVATVSAQTNALRTALQTLFPVTTRVEIWKHQGTSSTARRRLLATQSESLIYVVSDTSADTLDGLQTTKTFETSSEILSVLQQADGTPVTALSGATFATFPVTSVSSYTSSSTTTTNWAQTTVGIAVLSTIGCSIVLLAAILAAYFFCTRSRQYRFNEESKPEAQNFTDTREVSKEDRHLLVPSYEESSNVFGKQPITGKAVEVESMPPQGHMLNGVTGGYHASNQKPAKKSKQNVSVSMMNGKSYDDVTPEHSAQSYSPALNDLVLTSLDDLDKDIILTKPRMHTPISMDIHSCDPSSLVQPWTDSSSASLNNNHYGNTDSGLLSYHSDNDCSRYGHQNGSSHAYSDNLSKRQYRFESKTNKKSANQNRTYIYRLEHELKPRVRSASDHWDVLLRKAGFGLQSLRRSAQIRRPLPLPIFKDAKIGSKVDTLKDIDSNFDIVVPRPGCYGVDSLNPMFKGRSVGFVKPTYRAPFAVLHSGTCGPPNGITSPKPFQDPVVKSKNAWAKVVGKIPSKQMTQPMKELGCDEKSSGLDVVVDS
ncbi:protocadherin Fat 4-like [Argopecten irradians]|uniref:protocadherin Fat 4-like n=1 Tax=Argopecten irradians TaxID=31199 RepID=UPI003717D987